MKKIFSILSMSTLLLVLAAVTYSCVRPDLSDCPKTVRIVVKTHTEISRAADDGYEIQNISLYLFDSNDICVAADSKENIANNTCEFTFDGLKEGDYRFIVWTNIGTTYKTSPEIQDSQDIAFDDFSIEYLYENSPITDLIPNLLYGIKSAEINYSNGDVTIPIEIKPNTYNLNFVVRDLPQSSDKYHFMVTDNNSKYKFDNSIVSGQSDFTFQCEAAHDADKEIKASMRVLKLESDRKVPTFDITNKDTSTSLFTGNLIQIIEKVYQSNNKSVNFDTTFNFDIVLSFDVDLNVSITVNGWGYKGNGTDL